MRNAAITTDILIVGAGPVGLFLANECARRKLRWRLVEARSSQSVHSKTLAIFARTLEIFDMAGIVAPFLEVANRVTSDDVSGAVHAGGDESVSLCILGIRCGSHCTPPIIQQYVSKISRAAAGPDRHSSRCAGSEV